MVAGNRSLNLSNAAAVAVYEAWRQNDFSVPTDPPKAGHP
jgi:tRNA (cytidine/uridine-2'-O-)-methyltransferase